MTFDFSRFTSAIHNLSTAIHNQLTGFFDCKPWHPLKPFASKDLVAKTSGDKRKEKKFGN